MVFGELVLPSSRALWEDDCAEYPEYESCLEWLYSNNIPSDITNLIVADTPKVIDVFKKCVVKTRKSVNELKGVGVYLYDLGSNNYLILCNINQEYSSGEVIEKILPLINNASHIYGITSAPITSYQGDVSPDTTCLIRVLCTKDVGDRLYPKLQPPNLVTGIAANLLSCCVHIKRTCQLFIGYLDTAPLDSLSSEPFITLFKELGIEYAESYLLVQKAPSNNLYM